MHVPINVTSPNNISKWQMGFNSAFKGLSKFHFISSRIKSLIWRQLCGHILMWSCSYHKQVKLKKEQDNSVQLSLYSTVPVLKQTSVTPLFKHSSVITVISYV
jgi:hypothetical protein